ncbi:hypothetical protein [Burkholderia oklahomensis]|uniref:hypothetical protein n=1 Tax=Burkholderia oklahomensis TaxID=342113 RepID=UPI00016A8385|nr:hypothetical protein [Burkholderia oklahomensis]AJX30817.1 hypothetical protein BG90_143 [Burkholderia oklahomensis C6786]AOI46360.1 hypothetical protein WI23_11540 [Burkholderia oklahomensis C6786]KUY56179.1 hypothetical protein WI23_19840 [Burkholderia oklahomensis C6786]MBI0361043.1 hypothetical protein [Burkholderia oklahomensis]SUW60420.1 Uncharacterised protein [Burkholderia oklahomensis]
MKVIKIQRHFGKYTPGDIAGFDDELADKLLNAEIASEYEGDPKGAKSVAKGESAKPAVAKG